MTKKVIFAVPTIKRPYKQTEDAIEASIPLIKEAGWEQAIVTEVGNPYISCARATMLRKALDAKADVIVFLDHDVSWDAQDLLSLIEAEGDVVAGTYRFKQDEESYMGALLPDVHGYPQVRKDGAVKAHSIPAGFLKITKQGVNKFIAAYPELCFGDRFAPSIDLFNHGAHEHVWYGEDYAFARRWREKCGEIWVLPNLNIVHHAQDKSYPGNFHRYLQRQEGGSESANPQPLRAVA